MVYSTSHIYLFSQLHIMSLNKLVKPEYAPMKLLRGIIRPCICNRVLPPQVLPNHHNENPCLNPHPPEP